MAAALGPVAVQLPNSESLPETPSFFLMPLLSLLPPHLIRAAGFQAQWVFLSSPPSAPCLAPASNSWEVWKRKVFLDISLQQLYLEINDVLTSSRLVKLSDLTKTWISSPRPASHQLFDSRKVTQPRSLCYPNHSSG